MNDLRMKITAFAVVLGLGALGGYAMSSNGNPTQPAASPTTPSTKVIRHTVHAKPKMTPRASGTPGGAAIASATPVSQPVSTGSSGSSSSAPSHSPVRTGSSSGGGGGGGGGEREGGERGDD